MLQAYLLIFGAKLAMALHREHVGRALPLDGAAWCQFRLNGSMTQAHLDTLIDRLPGYETLRQGSKHVADQFAYRYNTDERTTVAAVVQFHRGLWFIAFASSDQRMVGLFGNPPFLALPASAIVRPGELLSRVPVPLTAPRTPTAFAPSKPKR